VDQSPETKQEKDEDLNKVDLKYSSRSFRAILIGFIFAVLLFVLTFFPSGGGDVSGSPILAVLSLIISGIISFAISLSGIMKCGRLLYEYPTLKKDIVNEIYANLSVLLGIVLVVLLFAKYIRRGFPFFF
jgi:hypothetical protein